MEWDGVRVEFPNKDPTRITFQQYSWSLGLPRFSSAFCYPTLKYEGETRITKQRRKSSKVKDNRRT